MTVLLVLLNCSSCDLDYVVDFFSLLFILSFWMFYIFCSLFVIMSFSTRVSNELGAGRPQATRDAICVGMFLTISQACIVSFLYLCFRNVLGRAFSSDVEVIQNVAILIKLLAISSFLDSTQGVLSGINQHALHFSPIVCLEIGLAP